MTIRSNVTLNLGFLIILWIKPLNHGIVNKKFQNNLNSLQLSSFDYRKIINKRKEFSKSEWLDILLRCCGYEPSAEGMNGRIKMLLLARLLPLVESNFYFIELGPRSTGKSIVYKVLTLYAVLISGVRAM